jgi:sugar diacid utilization regulator
LVSAVADGAGLDKLLPLMTSDLGVACWVLTPSGRVVAGTEPLAPADAARLARAFLAADRLPRQATLKPDRPVTLVAVNSRAHRLAGWFLACEGAHGSDQARGPYPAGGSDPARGPDSAVELAALVALERARLEEGRRVERRLAAQLLALLASDTADPAQLAPRLVSCGIAPDEVCVALVATISGAGPDLARAVLEEIVPPQAAVAADGDEALALVPTPPDGGSELVERIRAVAGSLAPGLAPGPDGGRLALGISDPAVGAGALHGAVEEARHAHRLAAVRARAAASGPRVVVVPAGELASHVLLLAAVPDETRRSFRQRLLGPLLDYDRTHAADLVATLEVFLAGSGSWTRSAEQLHVHVNTLRYRIRRIQELTGRDLGRLEDRVDFFLALRL